MIFWEENTSFEKNTDFSEYFPNHQVDNQARVERTLGTVSLPDSRFSFRLELDNTHLICNSDMSMDNYRDIAGSPLGVRTM